MVAADASNNGVVTAFDAALIAQSSAGIPNSSVVGQWKFVPPSRTYAQITSDQTGQHYDAVLVGEVSGNWQTPALQEELKLWKRDFRSDGLLGGIPVGLPSSTGDSGSTVSIPITVGNLTGQSAIAYDFDVRFDPTVMTPAATPVSVSGTVSSGFTVTPNPSIPGQLRVAAFGTQALSGEGALLNLNFDIVGSPGASTNVSWHLFQFNEGVPEATPTAGTFTVNNPIQNTLAPYDFDGDNKTDISIFRPTPGEWWYLRSSDGGNRAFAFGESTDTIVPADLTGDGKADVAFWRPSTGEWYVLRSEDSTFYAFPFGESGDVPSPADFDGDGIADAAVFRPSSSTWYVQRSSDNQVATTPFGTAGDRPVPADYDGDGKVDVAIFRPTGGSGAGEWWYLRSSDGANRAFAFGSSTDLAVPGDYTGDGKADIAYFRPSTGEWYVLRSEDSSFYAFPWGANGDLPAPGDYDGDGKIDAAVFRPSNSNWFALRTTAGPLILQFGTTGHRPLPNAFVR